MSSEWDALSASLNSLEAEFSTSSKAESSSGAKKHSAEIDTILQSRGKHRGTAESIDVATLNAEFASIDAELTDDGINKHTWSADQSEAVDRQFDDVAATMDAIEMQDELLDDLSLGNDADRERLQAQYRRNIANLTAEVDKIGAATAKLESATNSKGKYNAAASSASVNDNGLQSAMASVNALLIATPTVQTGDHNGPTARFTGPDNLPQDKLDRLKVSIKQGIGNLIGEFASVKERVMATPDLAEAVALTAPLANLREDFHLMARLCERPGALPKLELASLNVYKTSTGRLILSMKASLEAAERVVDRATTAQSTVVVRIARIVSHSRKELSGENRQQ